MAAATSGITMGCWESEQSISNSGSPASRATFTVLLILPLLSGFCSANHNSNNVATRVAKNEYNKAPVDFASDSVTNAIKAGIRASTYSSWPGLTAYYKNRTDQYAAYSISSSAVNIKITSKPADTTKARAEALDYIGVCVNYEQLIPGNNNSYLGVFICPLPFEELQNTYCCGNVNSEYCCEPSNDNLIAKIGGPIIVGPLFIFVVSIWFWSCCCRKKDPADDEEPMQTSNHNQPEEVKIVSRPPSNTKEDRTSLAVQSEHQTSCTSLGSEADNGYGSGPLAETKPLDPAYPPTSSPCDNINDTNPSNTNNNQGLTRNQDYRLERNDGLDGTEAPLKLMKNPDVDGDDNQPPPNKAEEVSDLHLSDPSLYEDPIA